MKKVKYNDIYELLSVLNNQTAFYGGCMEGLNGQTQNISEENPCRSGEENGNHGTFCLCKSDKCNRNGAFNDHDSQHFNSSEKSVPFLFMILMVQVTFAYFIHN